MVCQAEGWPTPKQWQAADVASERVVVR
jgi:hypothetical protein